MLAAMYENGGNTTHRFLDGHPDLFVYPFESQLGTRHVDDALSSTFPVKYRWPVFPLDGSPETDVRAIIDEETRVRSRTPHVSKFRDWPFDFHDDERSAHYVRFVRERVRSRATNVEAFFRATFEAWRNRTSSGRESVYVGYSPIVVVDAEQILEDLPEAHVLHVVRNPWSAFADTKKRPVPLALADYMLGWTLNQHFALLAARRHPDRVHIVRAEDVMAEPVRTLGSVLERLGLPTDDALATPTWNGMPLDEVFPWGTIRTPTTERNRSTAEELDPDERELIAEHAWQYLEALDYADYLGPAGPRPSAGG
jgi:hypothetical protein